MTTKWQTRQFRIGDICSLEKGTYPTLATPAGEYPFVVTAAFRRSAPSYQIDGEAVCVPLISSAGHGRATMSRVHYERGKFALANLLVALLAKDPSICLPKYLYHLLNHNRERYFVPLMTGVANVSLKAQDIADVLVHLPPVSEQARLVEKIESVATRITEARRLRESIETEREEMLRSCAREMAKAAPRSPLQHVAPVTRRPVNVKKTAMYPELGIRSFGKGTFHKPSISGADLGRKRLFHIHPGDLVFSNVFSWEGAIAVVEEADAGRVGSHRYITCVPDPKLATAEFLRCWLLTDEGMAYILEASPGAAGRNRTLGLKKLMAIPVPVPPLNEQKKLTRLCARTAAARETQAAVAAELEDLMPSLLDRAFRGQL